MTQYFPFILLGLAVLLFVLPARQRKRMQAQAKALQESLAVGTPVMTTSGMRGTVTGLGDGTVDLEIAPGVVVTFVRQAILEVRHPAGDVPDAGSVAPGDDTLAPGDDTPGAPGGRPTDGTV